MTTITKTRKQITSYGRQETKFVYTADNGRVMRTSFTEYTHVNTAQWTFHRSAAAAARRGSGRVIAIVDGDAPAPLDELSLRIAQTADAHQLIRFDEYALCTEDDHVALLNVRCLDSAFEVAESAARYRSCTAFVFKNGNVMGTVASSGKVAR